MRGRDAARKLTLKVNILQVFTIESSETQCIVNHNSQSDGQNKLKSLFLPNNTGYGILLQAHRGGTRIGNELLRIFFELMRILFVAVGFVYSR